MKTKITPILLLFILVSGLISCGPDGGSEFIPPPLESSPNPSITIEGGQGNSPHNVLVVNKDRSFLEISELNVIALSSAIRFKLADGTPEPELLDYQVRCLTNYTNGEHVTKGRLSYKQNLPVSQVLPIEVFTPTQNSNPQIHCDFSLQVLQAEKVFLKVELKKMSVSEMASHKDFDISFMNDREIITMKELEGQTLAWPFASGEVTTSCQSATHVWSLDTSKESPLIDYFPQSLFEQGNTAYCRLIVRDEVSQQLSMSAPFYLQNLEAEISLAWKATPLDGELSANLSQRPLQQLEIVNSGFVSTYVKIVMGVPSVLIQPLFKVSPLPDFLAAANYQPSSRWQISSLIGAEKINSQEAIYKLDPGGKILIDLVATGSIHCTLPEVPAHTPKALQNICARNFVHGGHLYQFQLPISVSRSQYTEQWQKNYIGVPVPANSTQSYFAKSRATQSCSRRLSYTGAVPAVAGMGPATLASLCQFY